MEYFIDIHRIGVQSQIHWMTLQRQMVIQISSNYALYMLVQIVVQFLEAGLPKFQYAIKGFVANFSFQIGLYRRFIIRICKTIIYVYIIITTTQQK